MKTVMQIGMLIVVATLAACSSPAPDSPSVRELGGPWVAPESCSRGRGGWVVSEQGCGFDQPCVGGPNTMGSVVFVGDDGTRTVLLDKLDRPNGVTVDREGNIWVAVHGTHEIVAIRPGGTVVRTKIQGAGLLNDITTADWYPSTVLVSDSVTGVVHVATLGDKIGVAQYATVPGVPNGLAIGADGAVAVATLGDLPASAADLPGKPGTVRTVSAAPEYAECADWHGGAQGEFGSSPRGKLDGIVPWKEGYLVSSIYRTEGGAEGKGSLDTTLWYVHADGPSELLYDAKKDGLVSAADIGLDMDSGDLCIPDLNGSQGLTTDGEARAKVIIVSGLR